MNRLLKYSAVFVLKQLSVSRGVSIKQHVSAWAAVSRDWVCLILSCRHTHKQPDPADHSWICYSNKNLGLDSLKKKKKTPHKTQD